MTLNELDALMEEMDLTQIACVASEISFVNEVFEHFIFYESSTLFSKENIN